ncbi:hypothetical protein HY642_03935 [Candidatus Woesearchaeota archaeon]|nr:hypothetical protein [Candidatus Woesearchaeota archaeon]
MKVSKFAGTWKMTNEEAAAIMTELNKAWSNWHTAVVKPCSRTNPRNI